MTVFKGFMLMVKRDLGMVLLYLGIFITISLLIQTGTGGEGTDSFEEESLNIAVIDRDGGRLAEGLTEYLEMHHNLIDVPDDKEEIQERLFYRDIYYVVTIPENVETRCLEEGEKLQTTKVPGAISSFYVDQQINTYLNSVKVFESAGYTIDEAVEEALLAGEDETEVTLIDKNGHGGEKAPHSFMFRYLPYVLLATLCYVIGFIMIAFRKKDVRRRMLCSSISGRRQNLQMMSGYLVLGVMIWAVCILLPTVIYKGEFLSDPNIGYYIVNAFIIMLVALAISFLVGVLVENDTILNGVVNVISLGMSFLCGVFVGLDILGKGVRTIAQFLPVYWYEQVNEVISTNVDFTHAQQMLIYKGYGIQLLFAAAILCVGLVISRYKEQE